jgi:phospholipid/cholesterol/gamma-HCH transport system substrate-binding protein
VRRLVYAAVVVALVGMAAVLTATKNSVPKGTTIKIEFDNAFGLSKGGDFRIGGVKAGKIDDFVATRTEPPRAIVTAKITLPGFDAFHKDAQCAVKPQSLIGEYYVDCQTGTRSKPKIKSGGLVPLRQTTSTVPQDLVNNIFRRPYKERLRLIIDELGTGLAGRPKDLAAALRRAHPGLREASQTLRILGNQNRTIENFIANSDTVVTQLEARKREVTRFIREAGDTAQITATRRRELQATFAKFPGFLDELTPTMQRLGQFTDQTTPLLSDAERAAPSLNTFFTRLGPFANAARPAIKSLGKTSVTGTKAFKKGTEEVNELRRLAAQAPGAAKPLSQFLDSLDDRRRAIDNDPRGKVGAPPAKDVSNRGKANNGGFTGMESLWTYFFWQSMALNSFDSISHVLRVGITASQCSPLENRTLQSDPSLKAKFDQCNAFLGPNQPGNTTPDFTKGATAASLRAESQAKPAAQAGERRSAGQPDAGPVAGQPDISKPQVTLPPEVQKLVDNLPNLPDATKKKVNTQKVDQLLSGNGPKTTAGTPSADPQQLLDYLLGP